MIGSPDQDRDRCRLIARHIASEYARDKVAKALLGLTIESPIGKQTIREKDHQANRGQLYGKTVKDPKYPFAIMKPVVYVDPTKFMD